MLKDSFLYFQRRSLHRLFQKFMLNQKTERTKIFPGGLTKKFRLTNT